MQIFAAITKVDEATGKVYGRAVQEVLDRSGEIFDYESSKPNFAKWSQDMAKATDGKSVGNVRAMHGKVAAGKLTEITFADAEKAIDVCAEIVDPIEREKCLKGVYSGFSIGGRYVKKWADGDMQRYTADPTEISLVDLPCVPTAQFTVVKTDGSSELRKFEATTDDEALFKWADANPDAIAKIAQRKDVNAKEGEHKYGDVKFADPENKKYPIDTPEHIRAAWNYIQKGKDAGKYSAEDVKSIKARIVAAWKDKIDPKGPPEAEKTVEDEMKTANGGVEKVAGEGSASDLHDVLDELEDETEPGNGEALDALDDAHDAIGGDDEVAKGDYPGHPFRGNQYVSGGGTSAHHRASFRAHHATKSTMGKGSSKESHLHAAAKHDRAARSAKRAGADHAADYHQSMARYHTARAARFKKAGEPEMHKIDDVSELAKRASDLEKAVAERDEMLVKAAAHIEQQAALIEKLKDQPEALKIALTAVAKGDDVHTGEHQKVDAVLKADGTVDAVATEIRKALRNPVMVR